MPSFDLVFLQADTPLTKTYSRDRDGHLHKSNYPNIYEVTSISHPCPDLATLAALLQRHAAQGHCLLKGGLARPLVAESRAGSTDASAPTSWVVLDVDGLEVESPAAFLRLLKLGNLSYVVQYSASHGFAPGLRCHIYLLLERPLAAPLLKQWLIGLNHGVAALRDAQALSRTGHALHWALDITACQNDKLIYIAPPVLKGGLKDPLAKQGRIALVHGACPTLALDAEIASTAQNRVLTARRINELRLEAGYEPRKTSYRLHGAMEVLVKPDTCTVTEQKTERGFVYLNLNGGDSWGYWHPEDNPEYLHNFKGEPMYLTRELLPDYWRALTEQAAAARSDGTTYLAFCDRASGAYWRGTWSAADNHLALYPAKNETQVRHFAKQHGMPLGDFIPEWDLVFDPADPVRVDPAKRSVNLFAPTPYMLAAPKKVAACPRTIHKVLHHALGGDPAITAHFLNWVAFILQKRTRSCTSWVLHGRTGTGKGVLFHKILRPLFGPHQTAIRNMESLDEQYNDYIEKSLIVFIDEVQTKALVNERGVMAKLRTYVTEEKIPVRAMYMGSREATNYSNWIFSSNMPDPVAIAKNDRRTNVGKYQDAPLVLSDAELGQIERELQAFHDYLAAWPLDLGAARTPIESSDRDTMIAISESSVDTVASALLEGNFEFLLDQLPTTSAYERNALEAHRVADYRDVLKTLLERSDPASGACAISRDELRTVFDYVVGNMPTSPNKFTSLLKHHRIHTTKLRFGSAVAMGLKVTWTDGARFTEYRALLTPAPVAPVKLKALK
jgi:hypothetical protein